MLFIKYRYKNLHKKLLLIASSICVILILVCSCTSDAISPEPRGWYSVASDTEFILYDVEFIDSKKGFIVGNWGIILYTIDGGESWTIQNPYDFTVHLSGVHFPTADTGYAVGQSCAVKRTIDGGATWNFLSLNVPDTNHHC